MLATLLMMTALAAPGAQASAGQGAAPKSADPDGRAVSLPERTSGMKRNDGFLPFFWDAKKGQLLLEIQRLDEDFFYGSGIAGGAGVLEPALDRGQIGDLALCRFVRVGPRVLLVQKQVANRSGVADPERTRVVTESFPSSVLAALPIAAEEGARVLVDATEFVLKDARILDMLRDAKGPDGKPSEWKQDVARSALALDRTGAFPRNTEVEVLVTLTSANPARGFAEVLPDGHTMTLRAHHTFLAPPEPGFEPRASDPRVGFIPQTYQDQTAPFTEPIERAIASRWRLEKRDPHARASAPKRPLVYYLDRGIPEPERAVMRAAALWWNHAFEEAGFTDALVLEDLPEGASFLDARYSGIQWVNRVDRSWSYGIFQADPRTGEILHAVALIDSHRRRTTDRIWRNLEAPRARRCAAGDGPDTAGTASREEEAALVLARLAYLTAHEVGHTLGLDHNWAATTYGWGSVMDYLAPNIRLAEAVPGAGARRFDLHDAYAKDVGAYDRLAIRVGYTEGLTPAESDQMIRDAFAAGVVFPRESDPRWAEYDFGADPVAWLKTTLEVRAEILRRFGVGQLRPGEQVYDLQRRLSLAYLYHRFGIQAAQQHVGGQYQANALAGDGQEPTRWVPAKKQREALELLLRAIAPENLDLPDGIVAALVGEPLGARVSRERFTSEAGDTFSPLTAARALASLVVSPLLDPARAARLTLRPEPELTFAELLGRLEDATWGAPADPAPRRARLRRVAQRVVLDALLDLAARPEPAPEVKAATLAALERLEALLKRPFAGNAEERAHRRLARRDLEEFLDKPEVRKSRPPRADPPPGRPI